MRADYQGALTTHPRAGPLRTQADGADLPAPHYSTFSRRARLLETAFASSRKKISHLVIDSTGLKLYGGGEWKVRVHGWARHRTWRKLQLAADADSRRVVAALITDKDVVDPRALPRLLKQVGAPVGRVYAGGAYGAWGCYQAIHAGGARAVIPPLQGSTVWADEYLRDRNANLRAVGKHGAARWKKKSGYHRRSLAETAVFRVKAHFTDKLRSREAGRQKTERRSLLLRNNARSLDLQTINPPSEHLPSHHKSPCHRAQ